MTRTSSERAAAMLRCATDLIHPKMRLAVAQLAEPAGLVARYHMGWADRNGQPACRSCGKGLRGSLALASARAVGGAAECALVPAVAVELVHNFSLLHDDIMDRDTMRRGASSAWTVFGEAAAILAGDAILALAFTVLADVGNSEKSATYVNELCRAMLGLARGQGTDLASETITSTSADDFLAMVDGKTGSLIAASCAMGAIAANASGATTGALRAFGQHLGVAFQIADDLLGLLGDPAVTGKPVGADVRRRKKTLPLIAALSGDGQAARRLADIYSSCHPLSPAEVEEATDLIQRAGGVREAQREMCRQQKLSIDCLMSARLVPDAAEELIATAELSINRNH
jgi:geranylgeranyl diphosphate synthase type I